MSLIGRIIPTPQWPAYAPTWTSTEKYDPANQTEHDQAMFNAHAVVQLALAEMVDHVAGGSTNGCILAWAGKITVASGDASNYGWRYMCRGEWTTPPTRSTLGSISAVGATRAFLTYELAAQVEAEFYDESGNVTGHSTMVDHAAVVAQYSAYSGLFVACTETALGVGHIITSDGSGATPTWTDRQTWSAGSCNTALGIAPASGADAGRYLLAPGGVVSYFSNDGGVTWAATAVSCTTGALVWDSRTGAGRWLKANGTVLEWNSLQGPSAGTAWATLYTFAAAITHLIALGGGLLIARLSDGTAWYSSDGGVSWVRWGAAVGILSWSNGYICQLGAADSYVSRRCF